MTRRIACFLCLAALPLTASASDWSHWRGPFQTGASPDKNLPDKVAGNIKWKAPFGSRSTPLVLGDRIYIINYDAEKMAGEDVHETIQERVMCLNADTGAKVWQHTFPVFQTDIVTSRLGWTNLAADPATGNIYAHGTQGTFLCLDGKSGKVIWQKSMGEEYGRVTGYGGRVTSPIVDENLAILGMCSSSWGDQTKPAHRYVAFDKNTGEVVWWSEPAAFKGTYYSAPVIATINGQRLLISGGSDGSVFALKVRTGEPVWHYVFSRSAINSTPVVNGNFVYIGHGEENDNPINNIQGRVICVDASEVVNGVPKLVWSVDDIHARYASPVYHDDRLYMPDDSGNLYCLDPKTGEELWKFKYGQGETRGSPVIADGKIYVGEVASRFHILEPGPKKCKRLDKKFFAGVGGVDVELNGTPAIANGRVYFSTSDEIYCIGTKNGQAAKIVDAVNPVKPPGKIAHLQIVPAEVALHSGGSATFKARAFDADGNFIKEVVADWSLPEPKAPPGAKSNPPALKGVITKDGKLTVDAKMPSQQSIVVAKFDGIAARARVRVVPQIPYVNDFEKIPDGAVPAGWINTQGKYLVKTIDGNKVLAKVNDKFSPLASRGHAYITLPTAKDYTIECDVYGTQVIAKNEKGDPIVWSPEMGVGANRYTLSIAGETKKLRIQSWDALPRIDRTVKFNWMPNTWYRLKLTTEIVDGKGIIRGKAWARGQKEPEKWTLEVTDSRPIVEGSAALYSYVTGNFNDKPGTEIYFDNLRIAPNKAPAGAGGGRSAIEASSPDSLCIVAPYQPMSFGPRLTLLGRPRR